MPTSAQRVLGIMSGSSLDGLDLAICSFQLDREGPRLIPHWEILVAETDPFPPQWRSRLRSAPALPGRELWRLHTDLGQWIGRRVEHFLKQHPNQRPSLIGSHGHTIFHDPERGFTTQIGDGAAIARQAGLPVVTEFRSADVAAGGQGAPLAPLADKYLFPEYSAFLNLGGIANLSVRQSDGTYLAGDISGCCQILDRLAAREGLDYDAGGALAAEGRLAPAFAPKMATLPYHDLPFPKSLDNGWVREQQWPLVNDPTLKTKDCLHSFVKWMAVKITLDLEAVGAAAGAEKGQANKVLVTGGGARNDFLLRQLQATQDAENPTLEFVTSSTTTGDFKEAALIALAALLRVNGIPNALASATGASEDTVNGAVFL